MWSTCLQGSWLITLGNSAIRGISVLVFAADRLDSQQGLTQVGFGEWKPMLLIPCIKNYSCHHGHFVQEPVGWWQMTGVAGERGWLVSTEQNRSFFPLNYQNAPLLSHPLLSFTWDTKIFTFLGPLRSIHIPLPQTSLLSIFFIMSLPVQTIGHNPWISI